MALDWFVLVVYLMIGVAASVLGCFLLWGRIANYSDGAAHASSLGIVIAYGAGLPISFGVTVGMVMFAALIYTYNTTARHQEYETLIAVMSRGFTAVSILLGAYYHISEDIHEIFFGKDQHFTFQDATLLLVYSLVIMLYVALRYPKWFIVTLHPEIATAESISTTLVKAEIIVAVTLYIALLIDKVGAIMMTSTLVIPVAAARYLACSCKQMVCLTIAINTFTIIIGFIMTLQYNWPFGVSAVCLTFALFLILGFVQFFRR